MGRDVDRKASRSIGASQRHAKTNLFNASDPAGRCSGLTLPSLHRHSNRDTTARSQARRRSCDRRRNDHHTDQEISTRNPERALRWWGDGPQPRSRGKDSRSECRVQHAGPAQLARLRQHLRPLAGIRRSPWSERRWHRLATADLLRRHHTKQRRRRRTALGATPGPKRLPKRRVQRQLSTYRYQSRLFYGLKVDNCSERYNDRKTVNAQWEWFPFSLYG